jgi:flagellin
MRINENMSAVIANKQLLRTESNLAASIERLSSGYKINKPGDNPAGMAISNKMRAQIDALDQAESNVSDAVSVMQIADGALSEVSSVLQRIRELSVQAANDTNSYEDKQSIQAEIDELTKEVDRISTDTEYNQKNLLDGSSDTRVYVEPKAATRIQVSDTVTTGDYKLNIASTGEQATTDLSVDNLFNGDVLDSTYSNTTISLNGVDMTLSDGMTKDSFFEGLRDTAEQAGCKLDWTDPNAKDKVSVTTTRYGSSATINMEVSASLAGVLGVDQIAGGAVNEQGNYEASVSGENAEVTIPTAVDADGNSVSGLTSSVTVRADGNRITVTDFNGFSIDFLLDSNFNETADAADGNFKLEVTDIGAMTIQTGGNQYQTMNISIPEVSAETLYLDTVDVTVAGGGDRAIATLDDAMARLSEVRSRIGAFQNRLEYAQTSLAESQEDMTSAYSGLMDTDMATEMVEYTQQNVLEQAATSVLSQANDIPQMVLSMLQ